MTKMMISTTRRKEIKHTVLLALQRVPNLSLPLKIKALCKSYPNIRLISFSTHMKHCDLNYMEMLEYCGTSDSCADYYAKVDKYIIYYNDIDKHNLIDSNRYRWNIAHELGHILLNHHKTNNRTRIFRSALTDAEYNYLENEADYFAQLILVPHVVLYAFKIQNSTNIKYLCKISSPASRKRYYEYVSWKSHVNAEDEYDNKIFQYYYKFIYKRKCKTCGAILIQRHGKYCPFCGQKTLEWGDGTMLYEKLDAYENGKLKECPTCKNEETNIEGDYCQICGRELINRCSNYNCTHDSLPTNARYCPLCGNASTFYNAGYLKKWNYKESGNFIRIPGPGETVSFDIDEKELPFY